MTQSATASSSLERSLSVRGARRKCSGERARAKTWRDRPFLTARSVLPDIDKGGDTDSLRAHQIAQLGSVKVDSVAFAGLVVPDSGDVDAVGFLIPPEEDDAAEICVPLPTSRQSCPLYAALGRGGQ